MEMFQMSMFISNIHRGHHTVYKEMRGWLRRCGEEEIEKPPNVSRRLKKHTDQTRHKKSRAWCTAGLC